LLSLTVIYLIAGANVAVFVEVEDGQDLSVVRHEGFADHLAALHELLEDLQDDGDDLSVPGVEGG
jgi:hypothetical protein